MTDATLTKQTQDTQHVQSMQTRKCLIVVRKLKSKNDLTKFIVKTIATPSHAKFQRSSARGTFSNLRLNEGGKKMCIFNGKLATSWEW